MTHPQTNWIGQTIGDRYQIEELIAFGGMSTVFKATDPNLRRTVAIKLIHPHLSGDPEFVRRFEQEAAAVAQLRHPNIIQVFDFDHDRDVYYMVLEYVPGETLQARLKAIHAANERMSVSEAIRITATICDAVAYAHRRGMIHRDLKPANVMLNPDNQPILMDFGVAKMLGETHHTATGAVIGTVLYMAPEQAQGKRPDERADIYSLGVMLFEMAAGRPPFEGDSAVTVMMKHMTEPVPDVREINSDIQEELKSVVDKALAKDPDDRFQTAIELAAALRETLSPGDAAAPAARGETQVTGREPALGAAAAQPAGGSRRVLWMGAAALAAVLLIVALGIFLIAPRFDQSQSLAEEPPLLPDNPTTTAVDPATLPPAEGMVKIDGGLYTVGLEPPDDEHTLPQHVRLTEFWIDQYEVTNAQFAAFLAETGAAPPPNWSGGAVPAGLENHPVEGVTWDQAAAYCTWAKKRLPGEAEWEIAARSADGRLYPWGNDERAVQLPRSGTYPVGSIADNRSPYGVYDMAGNVWEWVGDIYAPVESGQRVLRGGAHGFQKDMAYRLHGDPNVPTMFATAGIRCAADQVRGELDDYQRKDRASI